MIGSLVKFLYADDPKNICIVIQTYDKNDMIHMSEPYDEEKLLLIYDFKNREYFYALANELSFIYEQENK